MSAFIALTLVSLHSILCPSWATTRLAGTLANAMKPSVPKRTLVKINPRMRFLLLLDDWNPSLKSLRLMLVRSTRLHAGHVHSRHIHSRHLHPRHVHAVRLSRAGFLHRRRARNIYLIGDGTLRVLVPAGITIVAGREVRSHLHHRKHSSHFDRSEWSCASHHGKCVGGQRHSHLRHIGHA